MDIGYDHPGNTSRINGNEETAGRSRKRVSRACDRCRVKKDKCDGLRPRCSPCIANNVDCSYDPISKKRGLPEGYVRGLEKLWALSIVKITGLEDAIRQIASQERNFSLWSHEASGDVLHAKWKESGVLRELESMLSRTDAEGSANRSKRKREDDSEGNIPPEDPVSTMYSMQPEFHVVSAQGQGFIPNQTVASTPSTDDSIQTPLPGTASAILEHYFAYTHCWLPIVEKHQVMRTCYEYANGERRASTANLAVLWAILAYTSQQLEHENLERQPQALLASARELLPDENGPYELGHAQAMILMALLHIGHARWNQAWMLIGFVSRVALQLRSSNATIPKRLGATLQACCMLDTLIAEHLMLRPHLRRNDIGVLERLEEDGSEDWEPWRTPDAGTRSKLAPALTNSCFNRLVEVVLITNDLITHDLQDEEIQRSFLQDCRNALDALEFKYPTFGPGDAMMPHQFLLRAFHLSTAMAISKRQVELNASAEPWSRSACDTLLLFSEHQQNHALALRSAIPILEIPLRAASYGATCTKQHLNNSPDLLSYSDFASTMTGLVVQLSSSWAVFGSLASLLRPNTSTHGDSLQSIRSNQSFQDTAEGHGHHNWPVQTNATHGMIENINAWRSPSDFAPDVIDPQLNQGGHARTSSTNIHLHTPRQNEIDMVMSGMGNLTPAGLAMPAATEPSPSFYGDEVDAIFHNFVGLDTTDWTDNRQKGLAEFGFADEDAFQAFCNDPERLLTTNAIDNASFNAAADPWPPPGLYPGFFERPDPQMEASQILQSLSGQAQSNVDTAKRGNFWS